MTAVSRFFPFQGMACKIPDGGLLVQTTSTCVGLIEGFRTSVTLYGFGQQPVKFRENGHVS